VATVIHTLSHITTACRSRSNAHCHRYASARKELGLGVRCVGVDKEPTGRRGESRGGVDGGADRGTIGRCSDDNSGELGGLEATRLIGVIVRGCVTQATAAVSARSGGGEAAASMVCAEILAEMDGGFVVPRHPCIPMNHNARLECVWW
jgi:hypothetical protein